MVEYVQFVSYHHPRRATVRLLLAAPATRQVSRATAKTLWQTAKDKEAREAKAEPDRVWMKAEQKLRRNHQAAEWRMAEPEESVEAKITKIR